jgi:hypothetical protein
MGAPYFDSKSNLIDVFVIYLFSLLKSRNLECYVGSTAQRRLSPAHYHKLSVGEPIGWHGRRFSAGDALALGAAGDADRQQAMPLSMAIALFSLEEQ